MVETLDKWEKEFEIEIRLMLTGKKYYKNLSCLGKRLVFLDVWD